MTALVGREGADVVDFLGFTVVDDTGVSLVGGGGIVEVVESLDFAILFFEDDVVAFVAAARGADVVDTPPRLMEATSVRSFVALDGRAAGIDGTPPKAPN